MEKEKVFLRVDLNKTSTGDTTYYRLHKNLRDFLNQCLETHGEIEAIILTKEDNTYDWNIGFVLPKENSN